jgi:hypothetical protein
MSYLGNYPVTGDNSFRILDSISSYTQTFDGSSSSVVSTTNSTLTFTGHRFITGQRVTYSTTGTTIGGLSSGSVYYIIKTDQNTLKLASSYANALANTSITLTSLGTGSTHTLNVAFDGINTKFKATYNNGTKGLITRAAQLQLSINGVIQQPQDTTTPVNGFGIEADSTIIFSTPPAVTDVFWGSLVATNFATFDISDNTVDSFTGTGSQTNFSLSKTPANNQNVLVTINGVVQYPSDATTTRAYSITGNVLIFVSAPGNGSLIQARHIGFAGATSSSVTGFYGRTGNVGLTTADTVSIGSAYISGNIGIGTTNPTTKLTISGTTGISFADTNIRLGDATTGSSITSATHNFFGGVGAGKSTTTGCHNNFLGYFSGLKNTTGNYNNFFGKCSGYCNTTGGYNNFFGYQAGYSNVNGNYNNFFGQNAGVSNTSGSYNNFFGKYAGRLNTTGYYNNFFGKCAGVGNTSGNGNNFFGHYVGKSNTSGNYNTFFGFLSGCRNTTGSFNNFFGIQAGCNNITGSQNVVIGYNQQTPITSGDNQLVIGSGNTSWIVGNSSYNVGFGTTNPTTKISIAGTTGISFADNNIRIGDVSTGSSITTGTNNFFAGAGAGKSTTTGQNNNFFGSCAGCSNTSGTSNNFFGQLAGRCNTTGNSNNFFGQSAGRYNISGGFNNFFGVNAGCSNTTGCYNNFFGRQAGYFNATGSHNNFFGVSAGGGTLNASGCHNNFLGNLAGRFNSTGSYNNFFGRYAGYCNSTGNNNIAIGQSAGCCNTTGSYNNFFGRNAGCTNVTGSQNVVIGYNQQTPITSGDNQLVIGAGSTAWIYGNSSYNIGIGTTNPLQKLHIVGNTLISGITTITGNLNAAGNSYVKLARLTDQTITTGTDTLIGFSVISDSNNWYSGITTRTTPTVAGTYNVTVMMNWYAGSTTNVNQTNIQLRKNGNTFALSQVGIQTYAYSMNACGIVTMNGTTDYIDFTVYTSNSPNQLVKGTSDGAWTKMEIFKIN